MSDLVKYQAPDVMTLGTVFAKSGYFQDARDAAQGVVKILAGQELGFGPVASMTGIYIVKGRVSLSANLIAAAVKKGGKYNYRVAELSETACKIVFFEGKEQIGESSFTMEDAKVAGLVTENYRKFARNMLFARAMSNGAKWFCADVFGGPAYTPDELGAAIDMETGEMLERPKDEVIAPPPVDTAWLDEERERAMREAAANQPAADAKFKAADYAGDTQPRMADGNPIASVDRAVLMGKIEECADMQKLKKADRADLWRRYIGPGYDRETAPLEKLQTLLDEMRSVLAKDKQDRLA